MIQRLIMLGLLCVCTACTTSDLRALREVPPPSDPYLEVLSGHYLTFAESEAEQYDWVSSQYFADKGLQAAYGKLVAVENPDDWSIAEASLTELRSARARFLQEVTEDDRRTNPKTAADAQFYFDCWVEQQEEEWQQGHIDFCRSKFYEALDTLSGKRRPDMSATDRDIDPSVKLSTSYLLFFGWNEAQPGKQALDIMHDVAGYIKTLSRGYEVILHGHTDRSGDETFNMELSHARSQRVKQALAEMGVDLDSISVFAFGESDPRVPTEDGVREPANRRVEIFIE